MAAVINTNYLSLVAQNNLNNSQSALGSAIERLSSGLRINSAKDDAAGQAIANRFTANVNGLTQAARNANDGISIAQTTEGALNEINNNLQRIRELTVQAQNGTNSPSDLDSIQAEITQRLGEITRVSQQTQFNGVNVLASDQSLTIQVGANDSQTISINLKQINSTTLGLGSFDVTNTVQTSNIGDATTTVSAANVKVSDLTFKDTNTSQWDIYVDQSDANTIYVSNDGGSTLYTATYDAATNSLNFDSSGAGLTSGAVSAAAAASTQGIAVGGGSVVEADKITGRVDANPAADPELVIDSSGNYYVTLDGGSSYASATVDFSKGTVEFDSASAATSGVAPTGVSDALTELRDPGAPVAANLSGLSSALVGTSPTLHKLKDGSGYVVEGSVSGQTVYYKANVNTTTGAVTLGDKLSADPLASLDDALSKVDSLRSDLGAIQNRFESTIANLNNTVNNLSDARSRIQDADYATEVSNMTRAQILQQAGTAVLAQANQVPQTVLSLLR